jgi:hypothetical protein
MSLLPTVNVKKQMMKKYFLLSFALLLSIYSCRKDSDITTTDTQNDPPEIVVTGNLIGQIIDDNGAVVSNALVTVGNRITFSDESGLFHFNNIQMDATGTYIKADQAGYFQGSDRIYPQNGSTNFSRIQLLSKTFAGTFSNAIGGTIDLSGAKVIFEPNSLVNDLGELINNDIYVYAKWLDPTAENLGDIMPGALVGRNTFGQEVTMTSFGMMAVELYDQFNNEVFIAEGKEATIHFTIPPSLLDIAPNTIPLWSFDEDEGIWIEEGTTNLVGDTYIGAVKHFSFWNADFPYGTETIEISGCVKYENGDPATFNSFKVQIEGGGNIISGSTNQTGQFQGPIPVNETLVFTFFDNCGEEQEFVIGPFTENTTLEGCFFLEDLEYVTVSGRLIDCEGQGVNEGVLYINNTWPWSPFATDEDGYFAFPYGACSPPEIQLTAHDYANSFSTLPLSFSITGDTNIGVISVCDEELDEMLSNNADGLEFDFYNIKLSIDTFILAPDSINYINGSKIYGEGVDLDGNQHSIALIFPSIAEGSYTGDGSAYFYQFDSSVISGPSFKLGCWTPCNTVTINITNNEGPGGFLEGNYSGTSDGFDNMNLPTTDKPLSGTFKVRIPN